MQAAAYDPIAKWYDQSIQFDTLVGPLTLPVLYKLVGDVSGLQVCDLGCGQGRVAKYLADSGASVTAIDLSAELIKIAQHKNAHPTIQYVVDDAQSLTTQAASTFDAVVSNLAVMDMPDLNQVLQSVWRILRSGGRFVFSLTHPCFEAPYAQWMTDEEGTVSRNIKAYFAEGFWRSGNPHGVRGQVGAHHRTLATYVNTLIHVGFRIDKMIKRKRRAASWPANRNTAQYPPSCSYAVPKPNPSLCPICNLQSAIAKFLSRSSAAASPA